jgi:hypothetical protein
MAQRSILPKSQQQVRHCKRPSAHDETADPPPNSAAAQKFLDRLSMHGVGLTEQWARGPLFRSAHRRSNVIVRGLATSEMGSQTNIFNWARPACIPHAAYLYSQTTHQRLGWATSLCLLVDNRPISAGLVSPQPLASLRALNVSVAPIRWTILVHQRCDSTWPRAWPERSRSRS